jgi:hypothetical protein
MMLMVARLVLTGSRCGMFFHVHPLLKTAFKNTPLAADFEGGDLMVLDHSMKSSLGNFQDRRDLREGKQFNILSICVHLVLPSQAERYSNGHAKRTETLSCG